MYLNGLVLARKETKEAVSSCWNADGSRGGCYYYCAVKLKG